jgi:surfeit locus 1 family protein
MHFRPFPVLTLVAIPAVAALLWLGSWQAGRAEWKSRLVADYERAAASVPRPAEMALCALAAGAQKGEDLYRPIDGLSVERLAGGWPPGGEVVRMFGQDAAGNTGWRHLGVVTPPACIADLGRIVVEVQFEPFIPGQPERAPIAGPAPGRYTLAPWPAKPMFAATNSPETNDWHWFDAAGMEKAFGSSRINDRYYLAVMPEIMPAHLTRTPPATHIGYSATWYGMAIAFAVIYAVFHARAGRLRFRNRDPAQQ